MLHLLLLPSLVEVELGFIFDTKVLSIVVVNSIKKFRLLTFCKEFKKTLVKNRLYRLLCLGLNFWAFIFATTDKSTLFLLFHHCLFCRNPPNSYYKLINSHFEKQNTCFCVSNLILQQSISKIRYKIVRLDDVL